MHEGILFSGFVLLLAGAQILPAFAQMSVPKIDPEIVSVRSGGAWVDTKSEGFYRFIVTRRGFDHVSNQLFVQWIVPGMGPEISRIGASVGIDEINEGGWYVFDLPSCAVPSVCSNIELEVTHTYSGEEKTITLRFPSVGQYVLDGEQET